MRGARPSPLTAPTLRNDRPDYPEKLQLIRTTPTFVLGPAGGASTGLGTGEGQAQLHVAVTQQLRTDTFLPRDREPCWAVNARGGFLPEDYYLCRLAGNYQSLPVYEAVAPATVLGGQSDRGNGPPVPFPQLPTITSSPSSTPTNFNGYSSFVLDRSGVLWAYITGVGWVRLTCCASSVPGSSVPSGAGHVIEDTLPSDYTVTSSWANVGVSVQLPAGTATYEILADAVGSLKVDLIDDPQTQSYLQIRLHDGTNPLAGTIRIVANPQVANVTALGSAHTSATVTVTGTIKTITLQARYSLVAGATIGSSFIFSTNYGETTLRAIQLT